MDIAALIHLVNVRHVHGAKWNSVGSSSIYSSRYSFEGGLYGRVVSFCRLPQLCVGVDKRPHWEAGPIT